jgi:hypothetical protein
MSRAKRTRKNRARTRRIKRLRQLTARVALHQLGLNMAHGSALRVTRLVNLMFYETMKTMNDEEGLPDG